MAHDHKVLDTLDAAKTQWYHFTAVVVAGMGFFTDAYDLFSISLVTKLLGRIYYFDPSSRSPGTLPPNVSAAVNGVAFCGTLAGQLFFGWLGDKMGRKKVYGLTLMLMVVCCLASGLSFGHTPKGVMATLCFFRFWLGFGIGAATTRCLPPSCPSTPTSGRAARSSRRSSRCRASATSPAASWPSSSPPRSRRASTRRRTGDDPAGSTAPQADYAWRIVLMFGAVPALLTYYWRMKMPETPRYTALVAKNAEKANSDMARVLNVELAEEQQQQQKQAARAREEQEQERRAREEEEYGLFSRQFARRHGLHLLGTTVCWFTLDVAYYSQNLFQKDIYAAVNWLPRADTMSALEEMFRISRAQTLVALCGTIPGYWFTVFLIDVIGRFAIQLGGFFFMTAFMLGLAVPYHHWTSPGNHVGFIVMYAFTFFFANFGRTPPPSSCRPRSSRRGCGPHATASRRPPGRPAPSWVPSGSCTRRRAGIRPRPTLGTRQASACATRCSCSPASMSSDFCLLSLCRSPRASRSKSSPARRTKRQLGSRSYQPNQTEYN